MHETGCPPRPEVPSELLWVVSRLYRGAGAPRTSAPTAAADERAPASIPVLERLQQHTEGTAAMVVLDQLPFGILILDECCRLVLANSAGSRIVASGDPLVVDENGRVHPAVTDEPCRFHEAVAGACHASGSSDARGIEVSRVHGPGMVRLLAVRTGTAPESSAAVLLPDPEREHALRRLLTGLFGLTPAEAHVALMMMHGHSIEDVAHANRILARTVRMQWQTAVRKVGSASESDLVAMLRTALLLNQPEPVDRASFPLVDGFARRR